MRNMVRSRVLSVAVMGCVMLGLRVSPVAARVIVQSGDNCGISSVAADGSPGPVVGNNAFKAFKFTNIELVVLVCKGYVPNLSGRRTVFRDLGCGLFDPETGIAYAADHDLTVVRKPFGATLAHATLTCTKQL